MQKQLWEVLICYVKDKKKFGYTKVVESSHRFTLILLIILLLYRKTVRSV